MHAIAQIPAQNHACYCAGLEMQALLSFSECPCDGRVQADWNLVGELLSGLEIPECHVALV
jgi:hypothetical protein